MVAQPQGSVADVMQRTMLVTGFPRALDKDDRLVWYNANVLPRFSAKVQFGMCFKPLSWLSPAFQVEFATAAQLHAALDTLRACEIFFKDLEEDGTQHKMVFRRAKTLAQKKQGQFNSHFYKAVETYIPSEPTLAGFSPKPVGGILYLAKGKRYEVLIRFKKIGELFTRPLSTSSTSTPRS